MTAQNPLEKYDHGTHWVSTQIEKGILGLEHPILVSVIKFTLPWNIFALIFTVYRWGEFTIAFLIASAIALLWVNLAPALIWYYDERVLPTFFNKLSEIISDEEQREQLARKYNKSFENHNIPIAVFLGVWLPVTSYFARGMLQSQGMSGSGSIFLWLTYGYALYIGSILGQGFVGPLITIRLIRDISDLDLIIDPLHPDGLGGLSSVGYCAIRTTLLFSTASLLLPLVLMLPYSRLSYILVTGVVLIYIVTVLLTFVYPTFIINNKAQSLRNTILDEKRERIRRLRNQSTNESLPKQDQLDMKMELQKTQAEFNNYRNVHLYPLSVDILIKLATSVLLPIGLFILSNFLI